MLKRSFAVVFSCFVLFASCASGPKNSAVYKQKKPEGEPIHFNEVWGWVNQGREKSFSPEFPLTDVCYFAASVGTYGDLIDIPKRKTLGNLNSRVHLVVMCDGRTLTHFMMDPQFKLTDRLINDILKAGTDFDGIQIDFETIPVRDINNFYNFLKRLSDETHKKGKFFTVCVPARTRALTEDAFPYDKIATISDRVLIMAYDEHWSTSAPGPIASYEWCGKVADYAKTKIPQEKLVMGLPFYGRSWEDENLATSRSFSYTNDFLKERKVRNVKYVKTIPMVEFVTKQKVTYWFEDYYSVVEKMWLYSSKEVKNIAFWRIGLEDPEVWNWIKID